MASMVWARNSKGLGNDVRRTPWELGCLGHRQFHARHGISPFVVAELAAPQFEGMTVALMFVRFVALRRISRIGGWGIRASGGPTPAMGAAVGACVSVLCQV